MSDVWKKIFKDYIECNNAIQTLAKNGIVDADKSLELYSILLHDIIETMKSEVKD